MDYPLPERCDYCQRKIGKKEYTKRVPGSGAHVCYACYAKLVKKKSPKPEKPLQLEISEAAFTVEQEGPHVKK